MNTGVEIMSLNHFSSFQIQIWHHINNKKVKVHGGKKYKTPKDDKGTSTGSKTH